MCCIFTALKLPLSNLSRHIKGTSPAPRGLLAWKRLRALTHGNMKMQGVRIRTRPATISTIHRDNHPGSDTKSIVPQLLEGELREKAEWIRDVLEPAIAINGDEHLSPDTALAVYTFFERLLFQHASPILTADVLRRTRIHNAVLLIAGRGTRWPTQVIDIADKIISAWTKRLGKLEAIRPDLFGPGGRLHGRGVLLSGKEEIGDRAELLAKWLGDPSSLVSPLNALEHGHLEFTPGQWWIHPLYAFHDGIIESPDTDGGITSDGDGAYAITMTGYDEILPAQIETTFGRYDAFTPDSFTYRCRDTDAGRFKLIGAILPPRLPVRVLRSHTLHSLWAPVFGVRYDGLYRVTKYSMCKISGKVTFDVTLTREASQTPMSEVLRHPNASEIDDYLEYKQLRQSWKLRDAIDPALEKHLHEMKEERPKDSDISTRKSIEETLAPRKSPRTSTVLESVARVVERKSAIDHGRDSNAVILEHVRNLSLDEVVTSPLSYPEAEQAAQEKEGLKAITTCISCPETAREQADYFESHDDRTISEAFAVPTGRQDDKGVPTSSKGVGSEECGESHDMTRQDSGVAVPDLRRTSSNISPHSSSFDGYFDRKPRRQPVDNLNSIQRQGVAVANPPDAKAMARLAVRLQQLSDTVARRGYVGLGFRHDLRELGKLVQIWRLSSAKEEVDIEWRLWKIEGLLAEMGAWGEALTLDVYIPELDV